MFAINDGCSKAENSYKSRAFLADGVLEFPCSSESSWPTVDLPQVEGMLQGSSISTIDVPHKTTR